MAVPERTSPVQVALPSIPHLDVPFPQCGNRPTEQVCSEVTALSDKNHRLCRLPLATSGQLNKGVFNCWSISA
jgi:hypothetical protein